MHTWAMFLAALALFRRGVLYGLLELLLQLLLFFADRYQQLIMGRKDLEVYVSFRENITRANAPST